MRVKLFCLPCNNVTLSDTVQSSGIERGSDIWLPGFKSQLLHLLVISYVTLG